MKTPPHTLYRGRAKSASVPGGGAIKEVQFAELDVSLTAMTMRAATFQII
jgi:hypothetical protein